MTQDIHNEYTTEYCVSHNGMMLAIFLHECGRDNPQARREGDKMTVSEFIEGLRVYEESDISIGVFCIHTGAPLEIQDITIDSDGHVWIEI